MTHLHLVSLNGKPVDIRGGPQVGRRVGYRGGDGELDVWGSAFRGYFTTLRAAGRSTSTIRLHRHYLTQLAKEHNDPWQVQAADLLDLLSHDRWGPESRKSARAVFRGFYRWAVAADVTEHDPSKDLPTVRVHRGVPRPAPENVAQAVMHDEDDRVALMAKLAGMCGLRAAEISKVHANDYSPDSGQLTVHGKGSKERTIPIVDDELREQLEQLGAWAFPGKTNGHLSPGHVSRLLSRAMPKRWTAHNLRHRAGTRAYLGTRDVLAVSRMLGHARTETTQGYVQIDDAALLAAMNAAAA